MPVPQAVTRHSVTPFVWGVTPYGQADSQALCHSVWVPKQQTCGTNIVSGGRATPTYGTNVPYGAHIDTCAIPVLEHNHPNECHPGVCSAAGLCTV